MVSSPPDVIRKVLSHRLKKSVDDLGLTPAAVLLLLYVKDGEYCVLLNKRSDVVVNNSGDIAQLARTVNSLWASRVKGRTVEK